MTDQTVSETLNRAADHIAKYGLERGRGHGEGPIRTAPACAIGAINVACWDEMLHRDDALATPARAALADYLDGPSIPIWSDSSTAAEVVETLRAAAIIAAAQETDVRAAAPETELVPSCTS